MTDFRFSQLECISSHKHYSPIATIPEIENDSTSSQCELNNYLLSKEPQIPISKLKQKESTKEILHQSVFTNSSVKPQAVAITDDYKGFKEDTKFAIFSKYILNSFPSVVEIMHSMNNASAVKDKEYDRTPIANLEKETEKASQIIYKMYSTLLQSDEFKELKNSKVREDQYKEEFSKAKESYV